MPTVIANVRLVDGDGEDAMRIERPCGVQVFIDDAKPRGFVQFAVRDFNLVVEIDLPDVVAAISAATLEVNRACDRVRREDRLERELDMQDDQEWM